MSTLPYVYLSLICCRNVTFSSSEIINKLQFDLFFVVESFKHCMKSSKLRDEKKIHGFSDETLICVVMVFEQDKNAEKSEGPAGGGCPESGGVPESCPEHGRESCHKVQWLSGQTGGDTPEVCSRGRGLSSISVSTWWFSQSTLADKPTHFLENLFPFPNWLVCVWGFFSVYGKNETIIFIIHTAYNLNAKPLFFASECF